ncbi:MAG: hypothetical protein KHZ90_09580 [Veillonella parvula]|uniref:Uncharacterized protein n=1 Tax=Veillonella parvula TaxID=29466 RepID=A0A942WXH5_VEIPA|nr:hypothetical protein [Veillonella parvula]MBS4894005.1 hypothetical protein [Veillonella parvula]
MNFSEFRYLIDWSQANKFQKVNYIDDDRCNVGYLLHYSNITNIAKIITQNEKIVLATRCYIDSLDEINKECLIEVDNAFKQNILKTLEMDINFQYIKKEKLK